MKKSKFRFALYGALFASTVLAQEQSLPKLSGPPEGKNGITLKIITRSGDRLHGALLYATDSLLVLWRSTESYDQRRLSELAQSIHFSDIERMTIERKGHFVAGLGYGLAIGGGIGALLGLAASADDFGSPLENITLAVAILGTPAALLGGTIGALQSGDEDIFIGGADKPYVTALQKNAVFTSTVPPEVQTLVQRGRAQTILPTVESEAAGKSSHQERPFPSRPPAAPKRLHLSLGGGLLYIGTDNDMKDAFIASGFGGYRDTFFGPSGPFPQGQGGVELTAHPGAEYNFSRHFRLGLARNKIPPRQVTGKDRDREQARGASYNLFVEYIPRPVTLLFSSRFETAIGAGLSYNALRVDGDLDGLFTTLPFAETKNVLGGYLQGSLDYYMVRAVSLQFKLARGIIPAIAVPARSISYPVYAEDGSGNIVLATKTLQRHKINFSTTAFSVGARLHF